MAHFIISGAPAEQVEEILSRDRVYSSPLLGPLVKYGAAIMGCQVQVHFLITDLRKTLTLNYSLLVSCQTR